MRASRADYKHEDRFIWGTGFHPIGLLYSFVVDSMVPAVGDPPRSGTRSSATNRQTAFIL